MEMICAVGVTVIFALMAAAGFMPKERFPENVEEEYRSFVIVRVHDKENPRTDDRERRLQDGRENSRRILQ